MEELVLHATPHGFIVHQELMDKVKKEGGFLRIMEDGESPFKNAFQRFRLLSAYIENDPSTQIRRPIFTELINSEKVNAFCYSSRDENMPYDFIGIHAGAIASAMEICCRLMSLPSFLPGIGDVTVENSERTFEHYWHESALFTNRGLCLPIDPVRRLYALELAMKMVDFIFLHEASHLGHGHLEFIAAKSGVCHMLELEDKVFDPTRIEPIVRQTLEMDADAGAIKDLLFICHMERLEVIPKLDKDSVAFAAYSELLGGKHNVVRTCLLASSLFYRLFQDKFYNKNWSLFMQKNLPWPAVPMREYMTNLTLFEVLKIHSGVFGIDMDGTLGMIAEIGKGVELAMSEIEQRDLSEVYLSPARSPETAEYLDSILKTWKMIRPELLPNVRRGRLAPAQV